MLRIIKFHLIFPEVTTLLVIYIENNFNFLILIFFNIKNTNFTKAIIMFSQIITSSIPESSLSVPKIALYFTSVMFISALSIIANVFVLAFHHKNVKIQPPMPFWV